MLTSILFCVIVTDIWEVDDLGIFHPLGRKFVVAPTNDRLFILDTKEGFIYIAQKGDDIKRIGGKGQGPGQMDYPMGIVRLGEILYVSDIGKTHKYDLKGVFVETVRTPPGHFVYPVPRGWLGYYNNIQTDRTYELIFWDEDFSNPQVILSWPGTKWVTLGTLTDRSILEVDYERSRAYVRKEGSFEIYVIELKSMKAKRLIHLEIPRVPVPEKDLDEMNAKREAMYASRGLTPPARIASAKYPQVFFFSVNALGNLNVGRDKIFGETNLWFSLQGEPLASQPPHAKAILVRGKWAFVSTYSAETGAGVARVPIDQFEAFRETRPLEYEVE